MYKHGTLWGGGDQLRQSEGRLLNEITVNLLEGVL